MNNMPNRKGSLGLLFIGIIIGFFLIFGFLFYENTYKDARNVTATNNLSTVDIDKIHNQTIALYAQTPWISYGIFALSVIGLIAGAFFIFR